jgi:hypothetical protein
MGFLLLYERHLPQNCNPELLWYVLKLSIHVLSNSYSSGDKTDKTPWSRVFEKLTAAADSEIPHFY